MALTQIKKILHDNIGLDPSSVGDSSIERAINHRIKALGLACDSSYPSLLKKNSNEFAELVEEVVVPETWFFRNLVPFDMLAKCLPEYYENGVGLSEPLRILSVPCSTGEEPYSIAITLMENGLNGSGFEIDAIDISKRAITKARRAIYGKNSFRESGVDIREKYFKHNRSGSHLLPDVKKHVNFNQANFLEDAICLTPENYDIIFCRNLLIYFDQNTQKKAIEKLCYMLKPDGVLFVGHAEAAQVSNNLFKTIGTPKAFAFRKIARDNFFSQQEPKIKQACDHNIVMDQLARVSQKDIKLAKHKKIKPIKGVVNNAEPENNWQTVDDLIKAGELRDASILCESLLKKDPEVADGYYYLGLIINLEGSGKAADFLLKKAIYLNPNHHRALGLSALLAEQRGDDVCAATLRRRESRARKRK